MTFIDLPGEVCEEDSLGHAVPTHCLKLTVVFLFHTHSQRWTVFIAAPHPPPLPRYQGCYRI